MFEQIHKVLQQHNTFYHLNEGITICTIKNQESGFHLIKDIFYALVNKNTCLYLSGGKTPKDLYSQLADEEKLDAGAVGMIDERYVEKLHANSNELMIRESGLQRYLQLRAIPFYPILQINTSRAETAAAYDTAYRSLNAVFQRSIGLLGIGNDGHIAGIAGDSSNFKNPLFLPSHKDLYISEFNDEKGMFKQRITMTFLGLSMMDLLVVLVLGKDKQNALKHMFEDGSEAEIPSRFLKRPDIAKKTIVITDQINQI